MDRQTERVLFVTILVLLITFNSFLDQAQVTKLWFANHNSSFSHHANGNLRQGHLAAATTTTASHNEVAHASNVVDRDDAWSHLMKGLRPALIPLRDMARAKLEEGLKQDLTNPKCLQAVQGDKVNPYCSFIDIETFVPLVPPLARKGNGESQKAMVEPKLIDDCLLYGIGIHTDSSFEQYMSQYCTVHAFDCTINADFDSVKNKSFTYHPVCIGDHDRMNGTVYVSTQEEMGKSRTFKGLMQVMKELGHQRVDYLKFDTEGSEWTIFETILALPKENLPRHINFEVHTEGANRQSVPPELVKGKNRHAVNEILIRFLDAGYAILDFDPNIFDRYCAELALVLIF